MCLYCCMCCMYSDILCMYVCMYVGEHLVQAMPFVPPLPCDKIDNNHNHNHNQLLKSNIICNIITVTLFSR